MVCLDAPLCASVCVAGVPGAGKSILVFHVLARQAVEGHSTFYVSTTHQPATKLRAQYASLNFLSTERLFDRIRLRTLDPQSEGNLTTMLRVFVEVMMESQCRVMAVYSFQAIADMAQSRKELWQFLGRLSNELARVDCTVLLVGEYTLPGDLTLPEFAMADVVIDLEVDRQAAYEMRTLRLYKLRGSSYKAGGFSFSINHDGIQFAQA